MKNYFDKNGNYINIENLSLSEIYFRASAEGYKRGYTDAKLEEVKKLIEEERMLTENDDSTVYKRRGE